jgi:predicted nucleotidyltransferase component of viral defense system
MHSAVETMLEKYQCSTPEEYQNALREIIQEIALLGLYRAGFFEQAAFYGGTALRIFYGLRRFSEDLDFSLLSPNPNFEIQTFCNFIQDELSAFGFYAQVARKQKSRNSNIESAFIKAGTLIHLLKIASLKPPIAGISTQDKFKIKLEVDINTPAGASYEIKYALNPIPYHVRMFTPPSLFAGKVHALLCRAWSGGRTKGRDLYDYVWYLSRATPLSIRHLEQRMRQTGHLDETAALSPNKIHDMLEKRFRTVDFDQAKEDVLPFIKDPLELSTWSADFFTTITREKLNFDRITF